MKASELMIGDWINVLARFLETTEDSNATSGSYKLSRENCRVGGLDGDLIAINKICTEVISYEPIPLTEEILKANGFKEKTSKFLFFNLHTGEYLAKEFEITKTCKGWSLFRFFAAPLFYIHYVHELQHAFRLCGLSELADNFKIE